MQILPHWFKNIKNWKRKMIYKCNGSTLYKSEQLVNQYFEDVSTTPSVNLSFETTTPVYVTRPAFQSNALLSPTNNQESLSHIIVIYSIVFCVAAVGNILVMVTLVSNQRMRTVTNSFLLSLSVSDLLMVIVCMPISLTGRVLKRFIFGSVLCKIFPYFMGLSVSVSTFTLLAISIERYNAICNPLKSRGWQTKSHAYKVIMAIWIFSAVIMSPYLVFSKLQYMPLVKQERCSLGCRLYFGGPQARQAWYVIQLIVLLCVPGIIMSISYVLVCCKIFEGFQFHGTEKGKNDGAKTANEKSISENVSVDTGDSKQTEAVKLCDVENKVTRTCSTPICEKGHYLRPPRSNLQLRERENLTLKRSTSSRMGSERGPSRANQIANHLQARKRVVTMLIVIVVFYFICWTPLFIVNVWKAFDPLGARQTLEGAIEIIQLMSYISTCLNPIIYCFMNKKFRDGFLRAFICCFPKPCLRTIGASQPPNATYAMSENGTQASFLITSPNRPRSYRSTSSFR